MVAGIAKPLHGEGRARLGGRQGAADAPRAFRRAQVRGARQGVLPQRTSVLHPGRRLPQHPARRRIRPDRRPRLPQARGGADAGGRLQLRPPAHALRDAGVLRRLRRTWVDGAARAAVLHGPADGEVPVRPRARRDGTLSPLPAPSVLRHLLPRQRGHVRSGARGTSLRLSQENRPRPPRARPGQPHLQQGEPVLQAAQRAGDVGLRPTRSSATSTSTAASRRTRRSRTSTSASGRCRTRGRCAATGWRSSG